MAKSKKPEVIDVTNKDYIIENLTMQLQVANERLVKSEQTKAEFEALLQVIICFIASKFSSIANFQKLGGWKNIWLWASSIPFFIDVILQVICILRRDELHECHNSAREERLNKWCEGLAVTKMTPKGVFKVE